jgi:glutathione S-transferase
MAEILNLITAKLDAQRNAGSRYYIGDRLSALDIYSACFTSALKALPQDLCPMATDYRPSYTVTNPTVTQALAPTLFEHRDYIYETYLELPIVF